MLRSAAHSAIARGVELFNRNPWTNERLEWLPRSQVRWYRSDGLWTEHAQPFLDDADFQRSYQRACTATGADLGLEWRLHTMIWAARKSAKLEGAFVECGSARGFMASGICEFLRWTDRPFFLFDTFESHMPNESGVQDGPVCINYAESAEKVAQNFEEWPGVCLVVGRVPGTLSEIPEQPIAFLHIDMNNAQAEEAAVRHLALVSGGIVILDDYGFPGYEESRANADRLGASLGFHILALPTGQGLAMK